MKKAALADRLICFNPAKQRDAALLYAGANARPD